MRTSFRLAATAVAGCVGATAAVVLSPSAAADAPRWRVSHRAKSDVVVNSVVALARDNAWAFGLRGVRQDLPRTPIAYRWNGKTWRQTTLPAGKRGPIVASSASSANNVWAVSADYLDYRERMRAAVRNPGRPLGAKAGVSSAALRWNGRKWAVAKSWKGVLLHGVTAISPRDVWVFGFNAKARRGETWHFDGRRWAKISVPFIIVQASARSGKDIWAVGATKNMMRAAVGRYDGRRWRTVPIAQALPRDPRHPGEPPAENVLFSGITAGKDRVWITGEFDADRVADRFVLFRDGRGWHRETTSKVADAWGMSSPVPDAQGGVSFLGQTRGRYPFEPTLIHRSAAGVWTQRPIRVAQHQMELLDIAVIPGTGSFWAVGSLAGGARSTGVVLRS